jgi:glycosyltransferase involved in cell wall biosynthesis
MFVMSSRWEGMPNAMIEAFSCNLRIVSTDCPFGPSEVLEGGKHGHLVSMSDPEAFAAAVEQSLASPIPLERGVSLQRFTPEEAAFRYCELAFN